MSPGQTLMKSHSKKSSANRAKPKLNKFARQLLSEWTRLKLPQADARLVVAVSGGADSVSLLLALDELVRCGKLKVDLRVAHLDHRLRKGSGDDARWVKALAKRLEYSVIARSMKVSQRAVATQDNLEQAARRARYQFLFQVARKTEAQIVLTAHTVDDQAETVLLNLLRGSGSDGLRGIGPVRSLAEGSEVALVRPLVSWARRADTESYCLARDIDFLMDEMNGDQRFARVRVRHQLLPLMASFNPRIVESLARVAELAREDSAALEKQADEILRMSMSNNSKTVGHKRLKVQPVWSAGPALRRRALRQWIRECRGDLKRLERVHILAVESLLTGDRGGRVIELPGGATVTRKRDLLEYTD